jgi:hypothetical protein
MMNITLLASLTQSTPEDRSAEFVPVTGGAEGSSAAGLLLAAYILMWACVFGLIWLSLKKLRGLDARMQLVEKQLDEREAKSAPHV